MNERREGLPDGFRRIRAGTVEAIAREPATAWVENALASHGTLHGAAGAHSGAQRMEGRGTVFVIPADGEGLPSGGPTNEESDGPRLDGAQSDGPRSDGEGGRWAVRHYYRGGLVASLMGDRFLRAGEPRPFREARASEALRARGFRTPRVIAAAVYRDGLFVRGDLVTEFVPDAVELAQLLFGGKDEGAGGGREFNTFHRLVALGAAGALVRALGSAGVFHADLNAKNILLQWGDAASPRAHLIDLDRCRIQAAPPAQTERGSSERKDSERGDSDPGGSERHGGSDPGGSDPGGSERHGGSDPGPRMYRRLCRSLRKLEPEHAPMTRAEWEALAHAFGEAGRGL